MTQEALDQTLREYAADFPGECWVKVSPNGDVGLKSFDRRHMDNFIARLNRYLANVDKLNLALRWPHDH